MKYIVSSSVFALVLMYKWIHYVFDVSSTNVDSFIRLQFLRALVTLTIAVTMSLLVLCAAFDAHCDPTNLLNPEKQLWIRNTFFRMVYALLIMPLTVCLKFSVGNPKDGIFGKHLKEEKDIMESIDDLDRFIVRLYFILLTLGLAFYLRQIHDQQRA